MTAIIQALPKLPEFSARVYRALLQGLYAEPGFSDVTENDIAKKLATVERPVTVRQVHGAVCNLIKLGLVSFYDMETCNAEQILYADIWQQNDYDLAHALKEQHLKALDEQLWYTTQTEAEQKQRQVYGATTAELDADLASAEKNLGINKQMYCISLLSDVQEEIALGLAERARQHVNIVKRILSLEG